jgi:hypothetical protein
MTCYRGQIPGKFIDKKTGKIDNFSALLILPYI